MTPEQKFMNSAIDATIQLLDERMVDYTKPNDDGTSPDFTYVFDFVVKLKEDLLELKTK